MSSPEITPQGSEQSLSPERAQEQLERVSERMNDSPEHEPQDVEKQAERARVEALETAISVEAGGKEKARKESTTAPKPKNNKKNRDASFKKQMQTIQADMSLSQRVFSKFIHVKPIEQTSDAVGASFARPNAILAGSITAFALTLGVYLIAKFVGYNLSGFETIGAFVVGWILGIVYDYLRLIITGKK